MRRIPQRHVPHHVGKVVDARVPLPNVSLLGADAVLPTGVDGVLEAHDLQWAVARQHGHDVVESNIFAVELFVNQISNVGHQRVVRRVIVEERDMCKGQTREDHRVSVPASGKAVLVLTILADGVRTRECSHDAILGVLLPVVEDEAHIIRLIVAVVVGQEDGLGADFRIGPELHVQTVARRHSEPHPDIVIRDEVGWRCRVDFVPDDDDFVERWDLFAQDETQGRVETIRPLIRRDDQTVRS